MAEPPLQSPPVDQSAVAKSLLVINRLITKAFRAKTKEEFIFIVLNDTVQVIRYDRALLWDISEGTPKVLGASGQPKFNPNTNLNQKWKQLFQNIKEIDKPQVLESEVFAIEQPSKGEEEKKPLATVFWFPILLRNKPSLGLWLENWHGQQGPMQVTKGTLNLIVDSLIPAYTAAWQKLTEGSFRRHFAKLSRQRLAFILLAVFLSLIFIRIPLRIVAPFEVVAKDPIVVTAPLEGIIDTIVAKPGQAVSPGDLLFQYDKRVPLQELKVAEKNVEITQADLDRNTVLGFKDQEALKELGSLKLKLEKAELERDLAAYQATKLDVKAEENGTVMIQNRDEWRGKPVKVGERILSINNPKRTKVEIRLPEDDNVTLNLDEPVKLYLNISPESSYYAKLTYISDYSSLSDAQLPSFIAEAEWVTPPEEVKIGLKGTAMLYGEEVSLFYFILRKPWAIFRNFVGI